MPDAENTKFNTNAEIYSNGTNGNAEASIINQINRAETSVSSEYYINLAKDWAIKMDNKVLGEEYSSKYYAELSKNYSEQAQQDFSQTITDVTGENNITIERVGQSVVISSKYYIHNQPIASNVWNIQHNLNKRCPKITLIDTTGEIFYPPVNFIDENNCQVHLIGAMAGIAYCE